MPANPIPMTLPEGVELLGEPCGGGLAMQRAALADLCRVAGWPEITHSPEGKPLLESGYCSLSHGGGWVVATRSFQPVGIDVEAARDQLDLVRRRFVGPADAPVLDRFGDDLQALCRLWTAKEAVFKVFGSGVDFLTGIEWTQVETDRASALCTSRQVPLEIRWKPLADPEAWLALAMAPAESSRPQAP